MKKIKKIGVDYHGVINVNPDFFQKFNALAIKQNIDISVISGGHERDVRLYLEDHHILYNHIFSLLDYFTSKNMVTFYEDGSFFVANDVWNRAKARYCFENNIDVHIDDSMLYGTYFQTPFCLYSNTLKNCVLIKKNIQVRFDQSPQQVLKNLEQAYSNLAKK